MVHYSKKNSKFLDNYNKYIMLNQAIIEQYNKIINIKNHQSKLTTISGSKMTSSSSFKEVLSIELYLLFSAF